MRKFLLSGRYLYAAAITGFGITQIVTNNFLSALYPVPVFLTGREFWLYFISISFIAAAELIIINRSARLASIFLGILLFILSMYPHLLLLLAHLHDPTKWTPLFEALAISSGAFIWAGILTPGFSIKKRWNYPPNRLYTFGKILFALSLLVFGVQHFMYTAFIETLIPAWIPFHMLWLYLIECAFIAVCISLLLNIKVYLSTMLLGCMFLLWVLILHLPLVFTNVHTETQWTSLFVALAMCGISFMIAGGSPKRKIS